MSAIPTIVEAARAIAAREISPVELTRACLDRAKRLDPVLNVFLTMTEERALAEARASEARVMAGTARGPLDGIPIAHKDIYNTGGIRTTAHSRLLEDHVPAEDATVVRRLADSGTVLLGKLATHDFAMGGPSFDLPWPPARNPWNPAYFTGGSSSGTGAALAAGIILGGTGSDTGGSIRGPASFCGVAGLKPTYGLVSRIGIQPLAFTLDHAGPMAWTAADCALLLQAMAGHDPADPASADRPVADFSAELGQGLAGLRIGVIRHFHETDHPVGDETRQAIEAAAALFEAMGARVGDAVLPPLAEYAACYSLIVYPEAFAVHEPWVRARFNDYGERLRNQLALGAFVSGPAYIQALRRRRELCVETAAACAGFDVLLTATTPGEAPKISEVPALGLLQKPGFTNPWNLTGYPAITVSAGFGPAGLPISIQLVAKPFQEPTLLRVADAWETATPWRDTRPALAE